MKLASLLALAVACTQPHHGAGDNVDASIQHDGPPSPDARACALGAEDTVAACSDGCDNDGDGYIDADDYSCCGIVANAACPAGQNVCPGVGSTWMSAPLVGAQTYHQVATATATFAATSWIWTCPQTPNGTAQQLIPPPPGVRQLTFHIGIPADAPQRTVLQLEPSLAGNVRYWTMLGSCGAGAACVPPPQTYGSAGTVMGALVPGAEIVYVLESDNSSTDPVTLSLDLTNQ